MNDLADDRLKKLNQYLQSMSLDEAAKQLDKTKGNPGAIFDLIGEGDVVGVAIAMQNGVKADITDDQGMTPLHHAAACDAKLIGTIIMNEISQAPWQRDQQNRLPLDVAREAGHDELSNNLQEITYPELFKDLEETNLPHDLITKYDMQCRIAGRPNTTPRHSVGEQGHTPEKRQDQDYER